MIIIIIIIFITLHFMKQNWSVEYKRTITGRFDDLLKCDFNDLSKFKMLFQTPQRKTLI